MILQDETPAAIRLFVSVAPLYAGKLRELESRMTHSTVHPWDIVYSSEFQHSVRKEPSLRVKHLLPERIHFCGST